MALVTDSRYRKNLARLKTRLAHAQDATLAMFTAPAGGLFVWASPDRPPRRCGSFCWGIGGGKSPRLATGANCGNAIPDPVA